MNSMILNLGRIRETNIVNGEFTDGFAPPPTHSGQVGLTRSKNGIGSLVLTSHKKWDEFIAYLDQYQDVQIASADELSFYYGRYEKLKHEKTRFVDPLSAPDAAIYSVGPEDMVTGRGKKAKAARWTLKGIGAAVDPGAAAGLVSELALRVTGLWESKYFLMVAVNPKGGGRGCLKGEKKCDRFHHGIGKIKLAEVRVLLNDFRMQQTGDGEVDLP